MRFVKALNFGLMVAAVGAGCNPNDFDTALDKAPVVAFDTGSAPVVLPLSSPTTGSVAARMLVSRKDKAYLAIADYDTNGKVTLHQATDSDIGNLGNVPVHSAASLGPNGPILLGTPSYGATGSETAPGRVALMTLAPLADGTSSFSIQPTLQKSEHYGIAVGAGSVTGDPASLGEFVVASNDTVQLLSADARTPIASTSCQAVLLYDPNGGNYGFRPMAVADFFAGGGDEIALSGFGHVVFVQYDRTTGSLVCLPKLLSQGTMVSFGASLVAADFDGDGNMDLAVGAPPDRVFVYYGPLDTAGDFITIGSAGSSSFGKQVAAMRKPAGTRLMVADATAFSNGRSGGGKAMLLDVVRGASADAATITWATLFDSSDDAPAGVFGDSLGSLEFNTQLCSAGGGPNPVPWASSGSSVLTYFNYPGSTGDLRCGN
jgi:hypothetical protein